MPCNFYSSKKNVDFLNQYLHIKEASKSVNQNLERLITKDDDRDDDEEEKETRNGGPLR